MNTVSSPGDQEATRCSGAGAGPPPAAPPGRRLVRQFAMSRTGLDAETFTRRLLAERHVAVAAGTCFASRPQSDRSGVRAVDHAPRAKQLVRIAFCVHPNVPARRCGGTPAARQFFIRAVAHGPALVEVTTARAGPTYGSWTNLSRPQPMSPSSTRTTG